MTAVVVSGAASGGRSDGPAGRGQAGCCVYEVRHVRGRSRAPATSSSTPVSYELIVSIADGFPGPGGDYSHDVPRQVVRRHIAAAHRHKALLVLDLQPGRSGFLATAKRWRWALRDSWVGLALALDPEWRMGPREVRTIRPRVRFVSLQ